MTTRPNTDASGGKLPPETSKLLSDLYEQGEEYAKNNVITEDQLKALSKYLAEVVKGERNFDPKDKDFPKGFSIDEHGKLNFKQPEPHQEQNQNQEQHHEQNHQQDSDEVSEEAGPRKKTVINTAKGFASTTVVVIGAAKLLQKFTGKDAAVGIAALIATAYATSAAVSLGTSLVGRVTEFLGNKIGNEKMQKIGENLREKSQELWTKTNDAPIDIVSRAVEMIKENKGMVASVMGMSMLSGLFNKGGDAGPAAGTATDAGPSR